MVILDDHTTDAEFCCAPGVFNGLWWGGQIWDDAVGYGTVHWDVRQRFFEADWSKMVELFAHVPDVIGADLRNEPSGAYGHAATWDGAAVGPDCKTRSGADLDTPTNWEEAAQETSSVVLTADPNLLIFVEGPGSSTNLSAVFDGDGGRGLPLPLCLNGVPVHKLVYSPHDYQWEVDSSSFAAMSLDLYTHWGKILTPGQSYTAPIWVGEFGGCDTRPLCTTVTPTDCPGGLIPACTGNFFEYFTQYLAQTDVDWSYWALNGTRSDGGANVAPEPVRARKPPLALEVDVVRAVRSRRFRLPVAQRRRDRAVGSAPAPAVHPAADPGSAAAPNRPRRPRRTSPACLPAAVPAPASPAS